MHTLFTFIENQEEKAKELQKAEHLKEAAKLKKLGEYGLSREIKMMRHKLEKFETALGMIQDSQSKFKEWYKCNPVGYSYEELYYNEDMKEMESRVVEEEIPAEQMYEGVQNNFATIKALFEEA